MGLTPNGRIKPEREWEYTEHRCAGGVGFSFHAAEGGGKKHDCVFSGGGKKKASAMNKEKRGYPLSTPPTKRMLLWLFIQGKKRRGGC